MIISKSVGRIFIEEALKHRKRFPRPQIVLVIIVDMQPTTGLHPLDSNMDKDSRCSFFGVGWLVGLCINKVFGKEIVSFVINQLGCYKCEL